MKTLTTTLLLVTLACFTQSCKETLEDKLKKGIILHEQTADKAENPDVRIISYTLLPSSYYYEERYAFYSTQSNEEMLNPVDIKDSVAVAKRRAASKLKMDEANFADSLKKTDTSHLYRVTYHLSFKNAEQSFNGEREIWINPATMQRMNLNIDSLYTAAHK